MSIRKRTWKTASGDDKMAWVVDYSDQTGKRHLKTFALKKEADKFLTTARFEVEQGTHTAESDSITVAKAAHLWLDAGRQIGLERATIDGYEQHVELHIKPFLGPLKLSQLNAATIRAFEDKLRKGEPAPGETEGKVRSLIMVKRVIGSLGSVLADAQERGLVARNVVRDLRSRRKPGKERRAERRQKGKLKIGVDIPTREEIKAIVGAAEGRWRPFLLTAIFTGLRASELRGLRWEDVDFEKKQLHVRQRADCYAQIGKPKSESGERTVPLTPIAQNALKEWKLAAPKGALGLVFPSGKGKVEYHSNILKRGLAPTLLAAGVTAPVLGLDGKPTLDKEGRPIVAAKYTGLHAFRHFYASWCINRRADGGLELPPKIVQERLGHSSIMLTMDIYGHLFPRGDDSAELEAAEKSLLA